MKRCHVGGCSCGTTMNGRMAIERAFEEENAEILAVRRREMLLGSHWSQMSAEKRETPRKMRTNVLRTSQPHLIPEGERGSPLE